MNLVTLAKRYLQIEEYKRTEPLMDSIDWDNYSKEQNEIRAELFSNGVKSYKEIVELAHTKETTTSEDTDSKKKVYTIGYEQDGVFKTMDVKATTKANARGQFHRIIPCGVDVISIAPKRYNTATLVITNTLALQISIPEGQDEILEYKYTTDPQWRKARIYYDSNSNDNKPYFILKNKTMYYLDEFVRDDMGV